LEGLKHELLTEIHEVRSEIHRTARNLTLSLTTIMGILNGIVFTALKLGSRAGFLSLLPVALGLFHPM
jgi:hypothetical protein